MIAHNFDGTYNAFGLQNFIGAAIELYEHGDTEKDLSWKLANYFDRTLASEQDEIDELVAEYWETIRTAHDE